MRLILIISIFLFVLSCDYVDIGGLFYSSSVEDRFNERDSYKNFFPPLVDETNYSFVVISDTHYYKEKFDYIKYIESKRVEWGVSFIVITGDIGQNGSRESLNLFLEDAKNSTIPIYPVIGNHDIYFGGYDTYKEMIGRTVYDFLIGDTLFVFLDTANGTLGRGQKEYLKELLIKHTNKNKILFSHYSLFDKELQSPTAMTYQEECYELYDMFERYKVNYFISGHLHYYAEKNIKGTDYILINDRADNKNSHLIVTIKNGEISYRVF